jgi:phosphopantetheinyl transferase
MEAPLEIASILEAWSERRGIGAAVQEIIPSLGTSDSAAREGFSKAEVSLMESHRHPMRRASWVAGRLAARRALRSWCQRRSEPFSKIQILRRESGEPRIVGYPDLHVSITHSGNLAVAVVGERQLGIDLEQLDVRPDSLVRFFFSPSEQEWIRQIPSESSLRCNLLWTRKEAVSKLLGKGGELVFSRLPVLDEERPWAIDSASTSSHAISLAMDRN